MSSCWPRGLKITRARAAARIQPPPRRRTYRVPPRAGYRGVHVSRGAAAVEFQDRVLFRGCAFFHERENDRGARHRRFARRVSPAILSYSFNNCTADDRPRRSAVCRLTCKCWGKRKACVKDGRKKRICTHCALILQALECSRRSNDGYQV